MIPFYSAWWDDSFDILKVMIRHKNTAVWVSQSSKKIVFSVIYAMVVKEGNNSYLLKILCSPGIFWMELMI